MSAETEVVGLTVDEVADVLLPVVKAARMLVDQIETLVSANCQSTNVSEEAADVLSDISHITMRHSRRLMHEIHERRENGRGSRLLIDHKE